MQTIALTHMKQQISVAHGVRSNYPNLLFMHIYDLYIEVSDQHSVRTCLGCLSSRKEPM